MNDRQISTKTALMLLEIGAVQVRPKEPFLYASGLRGPIYCDNRLLLSYPAKWKKILGYMARKVKSKKTDFDIVAGVATAGIPHASVLAQKLQMPMVYVRGKEKDHGKKNRIEGRAQKGMRAIVVEDLINTGGSTIEAVNALREEGLVADTCICIFSYGHEIARNAFSDSGTTLVFLSDLDSLLDAAEKKRKITQSEKQMVLEWRRNPREWSEKYGGSA